MSFSCALSKRIMRWLDGLYLLSGSPLSSGSIRLRALIGRLVDQLDDRSVGEGEAQGYVGLELGGVVVESVGLVAPVADGFGGGGRQEGVPAEGTDGGEGTV